MKGRGSESEAAIVQAEKCCLFMSEEVKVVIENAAHIWVGVERERLFRTSAHFTEAGPSERRSALSIPQHQFTDAVVWDYMQFTDTLIWSEVFIHAL